MQIENYSLFKNKWNKALQSNLDSEQSLVLCFADQRLAAQGEIWQEIQKTFPQSILAGCSTAGEIHHQSVEDQSVSLCVVKFDKVKLKIGTVELCPELNSFDLGKRLAEQLDQPDLRALFILSDGLLINGTSLVNGIRSIVSNQVQVSGGLAGDGSRFEKTWILAQGQPQSQSISAIGFYGDNLIYLCGSHGGWEIFGPKRKITKSKGNVLFEVDDKPALDLYKQYLGDQASELPSSALLFPLALESEYMNRRDIVRTVLSVDEANQSMTFAGDMPLGSSTQMMLASNDQLVEGAHRAVRKLKIDSTQQGPFLSIAVSCIGRRLVMGDLVEEEVEETLLHLPSGTIQTGFYSYGEISTDGQGNCDLHNQTMTLTLIGEK